MFRSPTLALPVSILTLLLASGCDRSSPTEPGSVAQLAGTWQGELRAFPAGEDWSRIVLVLNATGGTLTGTLTSRNAVTHPVSGQSAPAGVHVLQVEELPQQAPCSVTLMVERVSSAAMQGNLSGRCPNTLLGTFRLERLGA